MPIRINYFDFDDQIKNIKDRYDKELKELKLSIKKIDEKLESHLQEEEK